MGYQHALQSYIAATNTHQFDEVSKWLSPQAVYWFTGTSCTTPNEFGLILRTLGRQSRKKCIVLKMLSGLQLAKSRPFVFIPTNGRGFIRESRLMARGGPRMYLLLGLMGNGN